MTNLTKNQTRSNAILFALLSLFSCSAYSQIQINPGPAYSGPINFTSDRFIASGTTVTFDSAQVSCDSGVEIEVRTGATLIIRNFSTFAATNLGSPWKGIRVKGNPAQAQISGSPATFTPHQGNLFISGNSQINNAMCGALVGQVNQVTGAQSEGGGVVRVVNSTFNNCWTAVAICHYDFVPKNMCYFKNTTFSTTDTNAINKVTREFLPQVILTGVQGVFFVGCKWENTMTSGDIISHVQDYILANTTNVKGTGLYAVNSSYTLKPDGNCYVDNGADPGCIKCDGINCSFTGFTTALSNRCFKNHLNVRAAITQVDFVNNYYNIRSTYSKNLFVNRCLFKRDADFAILNDGMQSLSGYPEQDFIFIGKGINSDISDNEFTVDYGATTFPFDEIAFAKFDSTSSQFSRFYNNNMYSNMYHPPVCYDYLCVFNKFTDDNSGLNVLCNKYESTDIDTSCLNNSDWFFEDGHPNKFRNQGTPTRSHRNQFSQLNVCIAPGNFISNIRIDSIQDTVTCYYIDPVNEVGCVKDGPVTASGMVKFVAIGSDSETCEHSSYCNQFGNLNAPFTGNLVSAVDDIDKPLNLIEQLDDDFEDNYVDIPLAINPKPQPQNSIFLYPNPANDKLNIITAKADNYNVEIISIDGKILITENLTNNSINIASLPQGLYFLKLTPTNGSPIVARFVKQ